ncbi:MULTISPECIES: hypothetical protein [Mesorhizobium]|uniref:hypothetical protein n=1 Tax=Mesorhizobium TaxID=68287 RepID=UPI001FEC13C8|nr:MULTISPECIES: hypothetical protein [Mesorhizobium]
MDIMEPHGHGMAADILTSELANARERINRTELALERTQEILAENIALRGRIRTAVEAAGGLVKIDPPSNRAG